MAKSNAQLRREWALYVSTCGYTRDWTLRYVRFVDDWLAWMGQRRRNALDATPDEALQFWYDTTQHLAPSTVKQHLTALHGFYRWLQIRFPCRDPFAIVRSPRQVDPAPRPMVSADELVAMVSGWSPRSWPEYRDRAVVSTLISTAFRVTETCMTNVEDVDRRRRALLAKQKGGDHVWGPLLHDAYDVLCDYIDEIRPVRAPAKERALFLNNRGRRLQEYSARDAVRRVCKRLSIEVRLTPHGIKASVITAADDAGADLLTCARIGHHKRSSTTERHYIKRNPRRAVELAEKHHPLSVAHRGENA